MECWSIGVLEYWSVGGTIIQSILFHHSITPSLHSSGTSSDLLGHHLRSFGNILGDHELEP